MLAPLSENIRVVTGMAHVCFRFQGFVESSKGCSDRFVCFQPGNWFGLIIWGSCSWSSFLFRVGSIASVWFMAAPHFLVVFTILPSAPPVSFACHLFLDSFCILGLLILPFVVAPFSSCSLFVAIFAFASSLTAAMRA